MKYPFEQFGGFIAWYTKSKAALLITNSDFKEICDSINYSDPLVGANFKMAVFQGVSMGGDLDEALEKFKIKLSEKIDDNGWPYSYVFSGSEAISSVEPYLAAFCYNNKKYSADSLITTIDGSTAVSIQRRRFIRKKLVVSFSLESVAKIFGSSAEFFVLINEDDIIYFGSGIVKRLYLDLKKNDYDGLDYFKLMSLSYRYR